ncbi:MAG: GxxExxY protein [Anaerolineae bacterium]|nr:GxxExxY protein [Anaerolineae bacterium]
MRRTENNDPSTYEIIGAAIEVHRILGPGLLESLYEEALCVELEERNLSYERQKLLEIDYKERNIGNFFIDIMVENRVIVELKSVKNLLPVHDAQLLCYLRLTNIRIGLLINFNVANLKLGIRRMGS